MNVEYLVIGQGICGTWLSYYLERAGRSFLVIDQPSLASSSQVAAGMISPITGRRHAETWMAAELLPFAEKAYKEMGRDLGDLELITARHIIEFFATPQMRQSFVDKAAENGPYAFSYPEQNRFNQTFNYDFGCGEVRHSSIVHLHTMLSTWRQHLRKTEALLEETFDINELSVDSVKVRYKELQASAIIFCDGVRGFTNPYFQNLPFATSKGEALLVEIEDLGREYVWKKSMMLVPIPDQPYFWLGSNYLWEFENEQPTTLFREQAEQLLKTWVKLPYRVVDHRSAVRPSTLERRPFVGTHPYFPCLKIFNGMGTKGCSLAPYFANELVDHLVYGKSIRPEVNVDRFSKILGRNFPGAG